MSNINMNNIVVYILVVVSLAIGGWSLKAQVDMATMMARMDQRLIQLEENTVIDTAQDKRITELKVDSERSDGRHWKYLGHLKNRVMALEFKEGIAPTDPDLGD
jgi:NhaP-type Na+/H+ and K+/H+ antiporter